MSKIGALIRAIRAVILLKRPLIFINISNVHAQTHALICIYMYVYVFMYMYMYMYVVLSFLSHC
jgi:hypothetical protein